MLALTLLLPGETEISSEIVQTDLNLASCKRDRAWMGNKVITQPSKWSKKEHWTLLPVYKRKKPWFKKKIKQLLPLPLGWYLSVVEKYHFNPGPVTEGFLGVECKKWRGVGGTGYKRMHFQQHHSSKHTHTCKTQVYTTTQSHTARLTTKAPVKFPAQWAANVHDA